MKRNVDTHSGELRREQNMGDIIAIKNHEILFRLNVKSLCYLRRKSIETNSERVGLGIRRQPSQHCKVGKLKHQPFTLSHLLTIIGG